MLSVLTWGAMPVYALCMAAAVLISLFALGVQLRRAGFSCALAALLLPLSAVLGYFGARTYYVLAYSVAGGHGMGRIHFFSPYPYEYALCGAVLGVLLACVLSAAAARQRPARVLDAATLPMLLMLVLARVSEVFSDFGWGQVISREGLCFFPLAVKDAYGQWHGAVFFLEALCAAAVMIAAMRRPAGDGLRFATALLWFALTQIVCESLRAETIRWGFVRVQQVQCALFALLLLICHTRRAGIKAGALALRLLAFAACIGVVALMEFALDKWPSWPNAACYGVMSAAVAGAGLNVQGVLTARE